ncbi:MAG: spirocyclase AveC family protein [Rhodococcus sp. (in: high G+C Gram-positive bacteria)]|uniref:spirocyclase AveC family protein n=1 Tax=Rhodococcus sp. TaxID=1831 RepID=UPI003BAEB57E
MSLIEGEAKPNRGKRKLLPPAPPLQRQGPVTVLAAVGVLWLIICVNVIARWVTSNTEFDPAPRLGPDVMTDWRVVALRVFEVISLAVLFGFIWYCVVKPWRRHGKLSLDGKFVIGGVICFVADAFLNVFHYLFAWNSYNVNRGVWVKFLPFHHEDAPTRYAESLIWGPPMYVYFCAGVAIVACHHANKVRRRYPQISKVTLFVFIFAAEFIFDFVVENVVIRTTHAYAFARTYEPLTLWPGELYQFPIYESILVAAVGCVFTYMRMEAEQHPEGLSPIEAGFDRWRPSLQSSARNFAVLGFCAVTLVLVYHLPFNWLGLIGSSMADLPSYLMPG